jgi:CRP-like cAMP-binding protein
VQSAWPHISSPVLQSLVGSFELREYNEGMVIAWAGEVDDCMYVVKSGQCLLTTAAQRQVPHDQTLQGSVKLARVQTLPGEKLEAGSRHGEQALLVAQARTTTLVASRDGTQVSRLSVCLFSVCMSVCVYVHLSVCPSVSVWMALDVLGSPLHMTSAA